MTERELFDRQRVEEIGAMSADQPLQELTKEWFLASCRYRYSYNFTWLGQPIIQYPQDVLAMQEIVWRVRPDVIVETGVAHGGSLLLYASLLELTEGTGRVVGVDIDIRSHNRRAIEQHSLARRITLIEGSSTEPAVVAKVGDLCKGKKVLVTLDSNHVHAHVLQELQMYSPLVGRDSYLVVFDTVVEDMPAEFHSDRPWPPGNSPKSAVHAFLAVNDRFVIDRMIQDKLLVTVAPDGYLKCVKD